MYQRQQMVCLRTVNYSDSTSILSAYSRQMGRISLGMPSPATREGRRRRALTMPLSVVEAVVDVRPGRSIYNARGMMPCGVASLGAEGHPVKLAVGVFLADVLGAVLRESVADERLFDYVASAVEAYAAMKSGVANFHLAFLYHLGHFLGIQPDMGTWMPGRVFDLREGVFRSSPPLHGLYLSAEASRVVAAMSRMTWGNLGRFAFSRSERNAILDAQLRYYSMHMSKISELPSLQVVRTLF